MNPTKKVIHFHTTFLKKSEAFIYDVVSHYSQFEPLLICVNRDLDAPGVEIRSCSDQNWLSRQWAQFQNKKLQRIPRALIKIAEQTKASLVHAHGGLDGYRSLPLKYQLDLPHVTTFYGKDASAYTKKKEWRKRYKELFSSGDAFLVLSYDMKNDLLAAGCPENKIHVLSLGRDCSSIPFNQRTTKNKSILMIGRFVDKKGFDDGIMAFKETLKTHKEAVLNIIGDGEDRQSLEAIVRDNNLTEKVNFLGWKSVEDVRKFMLDNSILFVPSRVAKNGDKEGVPYIISEAMATGMPVVSTFHAGIPEIVIPDEVGFLSPERDHQNMALHLHELLSDEDLMITFSKNARAKIEKSFDSNYLSLQREQIYESIIHS